MFDERSSKKLPLFSDYVLRAYQETSPAAGALWGLAGCIATPALLVLLTVFLSTFISTWIAVIFSLTVGTPVLLSIFGAISKRLNQPRTPEQVRRQRFRQALEKYHAPLSKKRLHKEIDPVAGQLLEASAFHYRRICTGLDSGFWASEQLPQHWCEMKSQIQKAADDAMEDATMLCVDCLGKASRTRKDDFKDAFEGFADLAWVDALQNLGQVVTASEDKYAYRSPHLPLVFEPGRRIAEKLQQLADEVEQRALEVARESTTAAFTSSESIDSVLRQMQSIHQAETELDQQQRIGDSG